MARTPKPNAHSASPPITANGPMYTQAIARNTERGLDGASMRLLPAEAPDRSIGSGAPLTDRARIVVHVAEEYNVKR